MALDLSSDWTVIDDTVTCTYAVKTGEGIYNTGASVTKVFREEIKKSHAEINPALKERDFTIFHIWRAKLGSIVPKLGDKLTDNSSVNWIVKLVEVLDRDSNGVQRYRVHCIKEVT